MSNSSIIGKSKNQIIKELLKDKDILNAIGSMEVSIDDPELFIGTHIFNYNQNPFTIKKAITFITVQVHIPKVYDYNGKFVAPTIEIWIVTHANHMTVDNVPKVKENRNDYLSELIDNKLNGRSGFGIGKIKLISNTEGSFQEDYLYRKMIFEGTDLNESLCKIE